VSSLTAFASKPRVCLALQTHQRKIATTESRIEQLKAKSMQLRQTMANLHQQFLLDLQQEAPPA
jgi:hypothetical protein